MKLCYDENVYTEGDFRNAGRRSGAGSSNLSPGATPQTWGWGAEDRQHTASAAVQTSCPVALQHHDLAPCQAILGTVWKKNSSSESCEFNEEDIFCSLVFLCALCAPSYWWCRVFRCNNSQDHQHTN